MNSWFWLNFMVDSLSSGKTRQRYGNRIAVTNDFTDFNLLQNPTLRALFPADRPRCVFRQNAMRIQAEYGMHSA
jgi:hypothetical protein